jgi:hypothetical protein
MDTKSDRCSAKEDSLVRIRVSYHFHVPQLQEHSKRFSERTVNARGLKGPEVRDQQSHIENPAYIDRVRDLHLQIPVHIFPNRIFPTCGWKSEFRSDTTSGKGSEYPHEKRFDKRGKRY